jgi:hypothetical protein
MASGFRGRAVSKDLLEDWDLDLEEHRRRSDLDARRSRSPKLVHKLMFSMPAGTSPDKVLMAREELRSGRNSLSSIATPWSLAHG